MKFIHACARIIDNLKTIAMKIHCALVYLIKQKIIALLSFLTSIQRNENALHSEFLYLSTLSEIKFYYFGIFIQSMSLKGEL